MTSFRLGGAALACLLALGGGARSEAAKPAAPPSPAAPVPTPKPTPAAPVAAPAQKPASPPPAAASVAPAAQAGMSQSKYLSALYSEIAKRTPQDNAAGPGEVTASFVVGPTGKVEKVTIDKTTSPAHAEIVKKILAGVTAPPPPGGSMDVGQTFRFR